MRHLPKWAFCFPQHPRENKKFCPTASGPFVLLKMLSKCSKYHFKDSKIYKLPDDNVECKTFVEIPLKSPWGFYLADRVSLVPFCRLSPPTTTQYLVFFCINNCLSPQLTSLGTISKKRQRRRHLKHQVLLKNLKEAMINWNRRLFYDLKKGFAWVLLVKRFLCLCWNRP